MNCLQKLVTIFCLHKLGTNFQLEKEIRKNLESWSECSLYSVFLPNSH